MLSLPNFDVTLVHRLEDGNFENNNIALPNLIANNQLGLILYFYPKDNTSGCTLQATDFSKNLTSFLAKGYQVIGVSRDSIKSHQNFITKQALKLPLISDTDEHLCQHFDVIKEKLMYGKTHLGVVRSTFIFDRTGVLIHEFRNVKAKDHCQMLLDLL